MKVVGYSSEYLTIFYLYLCIVEFRKMGIFQAFP